MQYFYFTVNVHNDNVQELKKDTQASFNSFALLFKIVLEPSAATSR